MKPSLNNISPIYAGVRTGWHVYKMITEPPVEIALQRAKGPFRPNEWDSVSAEQVAARTSISDGTTAYFFDAVMRIEHLTSTRITEHPVQTGANISDHAFELPARISLEIGMSDVLDVYKKGQFSDYSSKSVSAYQVLESLRKKRLPLTVTTRLNTYYNMLIENIMAPDDFKTTFGLRAIVHLRQIITAQVPKVQVVSKRKQVTDTTNKGPVQSTPLDNSSILSRAEKMVKQNLSTAQRGYTGTW